MTYATACAFEHILDLLARVDVPLRHYAAFVHGGFHFLGQSHLPFSDGLHRLERQLGLDALQDQVVHDIVSAADTAGQRNALADQLGGIAEPNIRAVRQTGNRETSSANVDGCVSRPCRARTWCRTRAPPHSRGHRGWVDIRVFALVLECLARVEQAHGLRVIERNLPARSRR